MLRSRNPLRTALVALLAVLPAEGRGQPPAPALRRPTLTLGPDGNLICPPGTSRKRDTHPPRWGDTTWDEWCARADGTREGPHASWYAGPKTVGQALAEGQLHRVEWLRAGRAHGPLLQYFAGEHVYSHWPRAKTVSIVGQYEEGRRGGRWVEFHPGAGDQVLRVYHFRRDVLEGAWEERHANGRPWVIGQYAAGKAAGIWRHFDERGREVGAVELRQGSGPWSAWYPDGRPLLRGELAAGRPAGRWTVWHPTGKRAAEIEYSSGRVSRIELWEPDGSPASRWPATLEGSTGKRELPQIEQAVRRHLNGVKYCYQKELQIVPRVSGRLDLRLAISRQGTVTQSRATSTTIPERISSCIASVSRQWLFARGARERRARLPFFIQADVPLIEAEREHGIVIDRDLLGEPRGIVVLRYGRTLVRERTPNR